MSNDDAAERAARKQVRLQQMKEAREDVQFILTAHKELAEKFDDLEHPIELDLCWAKAKIGDAKFRLSKEAKDRLVGVFERGQGVQNKNTRCTREKAVMELQFRFLQSEWDQKLVVTLAKVKSFFSWKCAIEQKGNDELWTANSTTARETNSRERGICLLMAKSASV